MSIQDDKKTDILLAALTERYEAQRVIRERVQSIGIWAIGLLLAAGGWIIQSGAEFRPHEQFVLLSGLAGALLALRLCYLADLERGFRKQQQITVRLETALGLYTARTLDEGSDQPIFPIEWSTVGTDKGPGRFFSTTYLLLYIGAIFLAVVILMSQQG